MSDPRDSSNPYGLHDFLSWDHLWNGHHYTPETRRNALELMKASGAAWIRLDFIRADIEPELGQYTFAKYDRLIDEILQRDIKILALLAYGPGGSHPWPQVTDPIAFARFAGTSVRRYKDRIRHWEVWNEPDHPMFWQPQDGLKGYGELLKQAARAIRLEDSTAIVHAAGLSQGLPKCLKQLYDVAGAESFDVVHMHPFMNPLMPDALGGLRYFMDSARAVMKAQGDEKKPIWLSQMGCPGMKDPGATPNWWLGKNPTENHQADWVRLLYTQVARWPQVEKIFWSSFRDTDGFFGTGADRCGLVRNDLTLKPSYEMFKKLAQPPTVDYASGVGGDFPSRN